MQTIVVKIEDKGCSSRPASCGVNGQSKGNDVAVQIAAPLSACTYYIDTLVFTTQVSIY